MGLKTVMNKLNQVLEGHNGNFAEKRVPECYRIGVWQSTSVNKGDRYDTGENES